MARKCTKCGKSKPLKDFRLTSADPEQYSEECLLCLHKEGKTPSVTIEQEYQQEIVRRILCRRRLLNFILRFQPRYRPGWVHEDICIRLEKFMKDVEAEKSPRLMLFMPPRHGKSLIASDYFVSWILGHHPEWEIIASSYNITLPLEFSKRIRERLRDRAYRNIFRGTSLAPDSQSVETWNTTAGGAYKAAGTQGGITGKGAHVFIIDDPVKDDEEADSETIRQKHWNWYSSTAHTRLAPGAGILIIQTRWHDDDLAGRALGAMRKSYEMDYEEDEIEKWEVVSYPAIAESDEYMTRDRQLVYAPVEGAKLMRKKGEALHPERYPYKALMKKKHIMMPRHWSALYQQNPVPDEGEFFHKDYFRYYSGEMDWENMYHFTAWDLAIGKKQYNDWTVGLVGSLDSNNNLYLRAMYRGRWGTYDIIENFVSVLNRYKLTMVGIEKGQLEMVIMPVIRTRLQKMKSVPPFDDELKPINDKQIRARPLQGRLQQGTIYLPHGQPWTDTLVGELLRFPGGMHDDIVDAMAWLVRLVNKFDPPRPKREKRKKSWKEELAKHVQGAHDKHPMSA